MLDPAVAPTGTLRSGESGGSAAAAGGAGSADVAPSAEGSNMDFGNVQLGTSLCASGCHATGRYRPLVASDIPSHSQPRPAWPVSDSSGGTLACVVQCSAYYAQMMVRMISETLRQLGSRRYARLTRASFRDVAVFLHAMR